MKKDLLIKNVRLYFRALVISALAVLVPLVLFLGMCAALEGIRAVGFADDTAAVYVDTTQGVILHILDFQFDITPPAWAEPTLAGFYQMTPAVLRLFLRLIAAFTQLFV